MKIIEKQFGYQNPRPKISVIIVAYKTNLELRDCLDSLNKQTYKNFETIVVDNDYESTEMLKHYSLRYYRLGKNYKPSYARNYGAKNARGTLLAFLDDDAITDKHWTLGIFNAFQDQATVAIRGKILPKSTNNIYTLMSNTYDLGESILDSPITLEGNCAVRRKEFLNVDGFDPKLYGHEGVDLSYKLLNYGRQLYVPNVVIYHNSSDNLRHYLKREFRHGYNSSLHYHECPEIVLYLNRFKHLWAIKNTYKLNTIQKFHIIVIRALSRAAFHIGSLLYRARSISLR